MVEVPAALGPAGIKMVGVTPKDQVQFTACIANIEDYSRHLIRDFESTAVEASVKHPPCPNRCAIENMPLLNVCYPLNIEYKASIYWESSKYGISTLFERGKSGDRTG
jgi:hypothetical protein